MKSLTAIILIVISIGLFFFQINPNYTDVKILRAQSSQYDEALKVAEELKEIRKDLADRLSSFSEEELLSLEHFMPERLDTVRVILDVNGVAASHGIELKDIKISDSGKPAGAAPNQSQVAYNTTSMSFLFTTSYNNAQIFINDLEKSLRLIDIVSVSVKPSVAKPGNYDFSISLNTYWIGKK